MIDLESFNPLGNGRNKHTQQSFIWISGSNCTLTFCGEARIDILKYFGNTVNVMVSDDMRQILVMRGNDRRVGSKIPSISLASLRDGLKAEFGENIHYLYFDGRWEETTTGMKVYLLELKSKEYHADMTIRKITPSATCTVSA